ncbi:MAG: hypothetical protein U1E67_00720 [Hyphomicrobiales bacterium]
MTLRNLVLIHRGPEYQQDFEDIANKARRLDPDISIHLCDPRDGTSVPDQIWEQPTLTVSIAPSFRQEIKRGAVLKNQMITKAAQNAHLKKSGIPAPALDIFKWGMKLDPFVFGEHVILKPQGTTFQSKGQGVHVCRRSFLEHIRPNNFARTHPIHQDRSGYIVQRFIYTGQFATTFRVTTFLGEILFCAKYKSNAASPDLASDDIALLNGDFTQKADRTITFEAEDDVLAVAKKTAQAFAQVPLLGIDIVRDARTSSLYVLELNPGGNTWHFSSDMWAERRKKFPHLAREMKTQFNAFDASAHALVEKTRALAS